MKLMDCVEVIVEKSKYAKEGVHKGMRGVIWESECKNGAWVVLICQCGEKDDIADLYIKEGDLRLLPDGMDARVNEQIKVRLDNSDTLEKTFTNKAEHLSDFMI